VYGAAKQGKTRRGKEELQKVQAIRAFFLNDVSHASQDIGTLREIDVDMSGTIDAGELASLRSRRVKPSRTQRLMEVFTTHPNMLKRIKRLSELM
jgi:heat shock protein HtpX